MFADVAAGLICWRAYEMSRRKRVRVDLQSREEAEQDRLASHPLGRASGRVLSPRPPGFAHPRRVAG